MEHESESEVHPAACMGHLGQSTRNTKTQGNESAPSSKVRRGGGGVGGECGLPRACVCISVRVFVEKL